MYSMIQLCRRKYLCVFSCIHVSVHNTHDRNLRYTDCQVPPRLRIKVFLHRDQKGLEIELKGSFWVLLYICLCCLNPSSHRVFAINQDKLHKNQNPPGCLCQNPSPELKIFLKAPVDFPKAARDPVIVFFPCFPSFKGHLLQEASWLQPTILLSLLSPTPLTVSCGLIRSITMTVPMSWTKF